MDIGLAELEVSYGASGETATWVWFWFREAGHDEVLRIDPAHLPVNRGG